MNEKMERNSENDEIRVNLCLGFGEENLVYMNSLARTQTHLKKREKERNKNLKTYKYAILSW